MKTGAKALLLSLCGALVITASAVGTFAYLTDEDADANTFTVGNVSLTLDEAKVGEDGKPVTPQERIEAGSNAGNTYHLLPGHTYVKDPTVTIKKGSEDAYVRMLVEVENMTDLRLAFPNEGETEKYYGEDGTFLLQLLCVDENGESTWDENTWNFVDYDQSTCTYEFRYYDVDAKTDIVQRSDSTTKLEALFTNITVPGEVKADDLDHLEKVKIVVYAHAMQATGFTDADTAWNAFDTQVDY